MGFGGMGAGRRFGVMGIPLGGVRVLPTFAFQAETLTADAAMTAAGSPWTARRKKSFDRMVRRAKAQGITFGPSGISHLYVVGDSEAQWLINLANPGTNNLTKVGTPTHTANDGVTTAALGSYYDTGVQLGTISQSANALFVISATSGLVSASELGAQNASAQGFALACDSSAINVTCRNMSASVGIGTAGVVDGLGFHAHYRTSSSSFAGAKYGIGLAASSTAALNLSAETVTVTILKSNGAASFTTRKITAAGFAKAATFTAAQMEQWHAILQTYVDHCRWGDLDTNEAGYQPSNVSKQVIVYGTTAQGVVAAYACARLGYTVAMVGGWRDTPGNIGGMSSGGLGNTDILNIAAVGGIPRDIYQWLNNLDNSGSMSSLKFIPRHFRWKMLNMLDGLRSGGQSVPIYYSVPSSGAPGGVTSVSKSGTRVTGIHTADGRNFTADYFIDASFEGDLLALAGCTMATGREAGGTGIEAANGYHATSTTWGGSGHQFVHSATNMNVDPFIIPGNTGSGLIAGVTAEPALAIGAADSLIQAYNFRMVFTDAVPQKVVFSSSPPTGYSVANYEAALRFMANVTTASGTLAIADFFANNGLYSNFWDFNNNNGFSSDLIGESFNYVNAANYAAREVSWQKHINHIRGLVYCLAYESDSRVPAGMKTIMLGYGFAADHYLDPHPNDQLYWPSQLYVREQRRLIGDLVWDANDLSGTDGGTPRSTKTIAAVSYTMDSHHVQRMADNYSGASWRCWNEGNVQQNGGGVDQISPLPLEIFLPKTGEVSNVCTPWSVSGTHIGFGGIRLEHSTMAAAEGLAYVIDEAEKNSKQDLQSVNYTNVRTALLAAPDTTPPVIPQVN